MCALLLLCKKVRSCCLQNGASAARHEHRKVQEVGSFGHDSKVTLIFFSRKGSSKIFYTLKLLKMVILVASKITGLNELPLNATKKIPALWELRFYFSPVITLLKSYNTHNSIS